MEWSCGYANGPAEDVKGENKTKLPELSAAAMPMTKDKNGKEVVFMRIHHPFAATLTLTPELVGHVGDGALKGVEVATQAPFAQQSSKVLNGRGMAMARAVGSAV